jgi:hypothetical protein
MLEITRELVEHYLRATGWTLTDGEWWRICESGQRRRVPAEWIGSSGLDLEIVVRATNHNDNLALLPFRLGLCAAAERDFTAEKEAGLASNQAAEQSAARGISGIEHLRDAGIEYLAWESARKR